MNYSYFPGCTLKTRGAQLDKAGRLAAEKLGFSLCEIPEWQCCGAVYPQSNDEIATRLASVRALMAARDAGQPLVSLCSACHHVLKRVNGDMQHNDEIRTKVNNYLKPETPYAGETKVLHYLEVLRDEIGWDNVRKAVVKPLTGRKIGAYYGCMLLRPSREMQFDDPENPKMLEDFIRAIGAEPVVYAQRNECCGGYMAVENKAYAAKQAQKIMDNASAQGAELLITACPRAAIICCTTRTAGSGRLLHRTAGRGARLRGGGRMNNQNMIDTVTRISGVNPRKRMRCGKCSASCPAYDEMEYHPHQFVSMVENGRIEELKLQRHLHLPELLCLRRALSQKRRAREAHRGRAQCSRTPAGHGPSEARAHPGNSRRGAAAAGHCRGVPQI
ncbi:MAG: heterodisulfide reductase-related iron-sulfur binding cluster [Oscillospiraceae bacterium]